MSAKGSSSFDRSDGYDEAAAGSPHAAEDRVEALIDQRTQDLKDALVSLETQHQCFNNTLDMLPAYVVLISSDYHIVFSNRLFKVRFGDPGNRRCYESLFGLSKPCANCETFKSLEDMNPRKWEWTGPDNCVYDISDYPFIDANGSRLILEIGLDITRRKGIEAELKDHRDHLDERVRERTEQLEKANTELMFEISEHMRTAQSLVEARDEWERTFNSVPDLIAILDKKHHIMRVNRSMAEALKRTPEACVGLSCHQAIHGSCSAVTNCPHTLTLADGKEHVAEVHEERLGGDFLVSTTPLTDSQGQLIGSVHVARDITERKRIEEALRQSREDLNRAQSVAHTGSWRLNLRSGELVWSDETHRIFGIPKDTPLTYDIFMLTVHPDDRPLVEKAWKAFQDTGEYTIEHRILNGDTIKWVCERAERECDSQGELLNGFGTVQDITYIKQAEEALSLSEARYRSLFNSMNEGFSLHEIICDQNDMPFDYRIVEINPAFEYLTGLKRQDVLGKTVREILPDSQPRLVDVYGRVALSGEPVHVEYFNDRLNKHFDLFVYCPVPRHFAVVFSDITERKLAEKKLKEFNRTLESRIQERTAELQNTVDRLQDEVGHRIEAQKTLRAQSRMLDGFFNHTISPLAILDRNFNFLRVNEAYALNNDRSTDDFIGRNHFELFPDEENQRIFEEVVRSTCPYQAHAKPYVSPGRSEKEIRFWDWVLTPLLDTAGQVEYLVFSLQDVTEQTRSQEQLRQVNIDLERRMRQLRALTHELTLTDEQKRRQMADVLHDDLQQLLVATKMSLERVGARTKTDPRTNQMITQAMDMLKGAITRTRDLSHELSPPLLRQQSLEKTLQWLCRQKQIKYGLTVHLTTAIDNEPSEPVKYFVFRAVQECLFNVVKHARVDMAELIVRQIGRALQVTVADKG